MTRNVHDEIMILKWMLSTVKKLPGNAYPYPRPWEFRSLILNPSGVPMVPPSWSFAPPDFTPDPEWDDLAVALKPMGTDPANLYSGQPTYPPIGSRDRWVRLNPESGAARDLWRNFQIHKKSRTFITRRRQQPRSLS